MTNKANSRLNGCPDKLKYTAYFSFIRSFMEYDASVLNPYQMYNSERVQRRAERFVNSMYSRYSSVSDMLDVLGWLPRLILFYQIINIHLQPLHKKLLE